jgi:hypothetical protein
VTSGAGDAVAGEELPLADPLTGVLSDAERSTAEPVDVADALQPASIPMLIAAINAPVAVSRCCIEAPGNRLRLVNKSRLAL